MTPEREYFNKIALPNFIDKYVKEGDVVIDIGKPNEGWGYHNLFTNSRYMTLDRVASLNPDIIDDMEYTQLSENYTDCVIGMGVWEQCNNPFRLIDNINYILVPGGIALFGILLLGFPMIQDLDLVRFTPQGVLNLLKDFYIIENDILDRDGVPSESFVVVRKKGAYEQNFSYC